MYLVYKKNEKTNDITVLAYRESRVMSDEYVERYKSKSPLMVNENIEIANIRNDKEYKL